MSVRSVRPSSGWGSGIIAIIIFSGTLPATRLAVSRLPPLFVASGRAVVAAIIGAMLLVLLRQRRPATHDLAPLAIVALGCVAGFPLLTSIALRHISAAHSVVITGILPLVTAAFGALRASERPSIAFWLLSVTGAAAVGAFALGQGSGGFGEGDLLMMAAVIVCGLGYAEGAKLSRRLGGWQVISWALLLALPPMLLTALLSRPPAWRDVGARAWLGFGYVSIFSMMLGFVFWYRGLARGGIAAVSQLQLLQTFLGLLVSSAVLGEPISPAMWITGAVVVACVAGARRFA